jgi:hypothetical protein
VGLRQVVEAASPSHVLDQVLGFGIEARTAQVPATALKGVIGGDEHLPITKASRCSL